MAWVWWEWSNGNYTDSTSVEGYNFFASPNSAINAEWYKATPKPSVPLSPKARDRKNLETLRRTTLKQEHRIRR